jgi:tRNA dimethylallyltransferase
MDVGTGKDLWEYGERGSDEFVPYHLIDIVDPSHIYTLYDYQRDFYKAFDDVRGRGRVPVVAGGSGLYIEAVLKGYSLPSVPENVAFRKSMMEESRETLLETLRDEYPQIFAQTDVSTKKRIVRALEVARFGAVTELLTDDIPVGANCVRPPNTGQTDTNTFPQINPLILYVVWERSELRTRIEKRLYERLGQGLIEEVAGLMDSGIDSERFALFGMEYKHVARYVNKEATYDEMTARLLQDIYHLAKRQDTWFRGMERRGMAVRRVPRGELSFEVDDCIKHDVF